MIVLVQQVPGLAKKGVGLFLKKSIATFYFKYEIDCSIPSRWKTTQSCTNNNFLTTAPLQSKCIFISKKSRNAKYKNYRNSV